MVQWIAIVVILSAIIGVLLYLGRDVRSTVGFIGATITDTEPLLNN
jgi:pheromone shutdown protein TraB